MRVFVTGASGWIGSAVVPELAAAGHEVIGLARSDASAGALSAAGAEALRGTLDDLDVLAGAAAKSDGVIHLAFKHEEAFSGDFLAAARADRQAVEVMLEALDGSARPFVLASGTLFAAPGRLATEEDGHGAEAVSELGEGPGTRAGTAEMALSAAERGIRTSVVRLPPTCHGEGDHGFISAMVGFARANGFAGYVADGSNRWPATHRLDVAKVFALALEEAPPGATLHAVAEEGVAIREVAAVMGRHLELPVRSVAPADAGERFGFLEHFVGVDAPASSAYTRELLSWEPTHPGLLEDLDEGHYFRDSGE